MGSATFYLRFNPIDHPESVSIRQIHMAILQAEDSGAADGPEVLPQWIEPDAPDPSPRLAKVSADVAACAGQATQVGASPDDEPRVRGPVHTRWQARLRTSAHKPAAHRLSQLTPGNHATPSFKGLTAER